MPGGVAKCHVEDILGCPTQRWSFAADRSRRLFRNRNYYVPDFLVGEVVVEIKVQRVLSAVDMAQVLNSMECAQSSVGLLVNFGQQRLNWKRLVL